MSAFHLLLFVLLYFFNFLVFRKSFVLLTNRCEKIVEIVEQMQDGIANQTLELSDDEEDEVEPAAPAANSTPASKGAGPAVNLEEEPDEVTEDAAAGSVIQLD